MEKVGNPRSDRALNFRRSVAAKATRGPWDVDVTGQYVWASVGEDGRALVKGLMPHESETPDRQSEDAAREQRKRDIQHLALCDPDTIMADLREIQHLRDENKYLRERIEGLERALDKVDWSRAEWATQEAEILHLAALITNHTRDIRSLLWASANKYNESIVAAERERMQRKLYNDLPKD